MSAKKQQSSGVGEREMTGTVEWTRPGGNVLNVVAAVRIAASMLRTMGQRGVGDGGDKEEVNKFEEEVKNTAIVESRRKCELNFSSQNITAEAVAEVEAEVELELEVEVEVEVEMEVKVEVEVEVEVEV